jgi:hypothetical protein
VCTKDPDLKPTIVAERNIEVSLADAGRPHQEVLIGTHLTDPKKLVACSMVDKDAFGEGRMHTVVYTSGDSGTTWKKGVEIPLSGDPVCEYGPDGTVYFGAITDVPGAPFSEDCHFKLFRSVDNGNTWEQLPEVSAGDRPMLSIDAKDGSLFLVYTFYGNPLDTENEHNSQFGNQVPLLVLARSMDRGANWRVPNAPIGAITGARLFHSNPDGIGVLSDGSVVVLDWLARKNLPSAGRGIASRGDDYAACELALVVVPTDIWKNPVTHEITDKYCLDSVKGRPWASLTSRTVDALAVDSQSDAFRDHIYVAWSDARSGHGEIMFTSSEDRGETWSKPRVIDGSLRGTPQTTDNFMPTLAVNKEGVIGLLWYDRRDNPDNVAYTVRFTASFDGGETWLPSIQVADKPSRFIQGEEGETIAAESSGLYDIARGPVTISIGRAQDHHGGDTAGLRADSNGAFHALWVDNRTGMNEVYTASIAVHGTVYKHGSSRLAELHDVTDRIRFDIIESSYDPQSHAATLQGRVRNYSTSPIDGPLIGRVLSLSSQAGSVVITNADNNEAWDGAQFDFTPLMENGVLEPGHATSVKTLRFRVENVSLPQPNAENLLRVLTLKFINLEMEFLSGNSTLKRLER